MNLHITERWLREKAAAEDDFSLSAGTGNPLSRQIEEARAALKDHRQEGTRPVAEGCPSPNADSTASLTVVQMRDELRAFMTSSTQTLAMAARNFEQMTDSDVRIVYEQVELLKKMVSAGAGR